MDAGSVNSASSLKEQSRCPLQEQFHQRRNSRENVKIFKFFNAFQLLFFFFSSLLILFCHFQLDRFIPNRSAMDFDYAHFMLTEGTKGKENPAICSPSREAYRKQLAEALNMNRTRILAFKNKPPRPVELIPQEHSTTSAQQTKLAKPRRHIPQVN